MIINHTSPNPINKIDRLQAPFFGSLFFSSNVYQMSQCDVTVYSIEVDDNFVTPFDLEPTEEEIQDVIERFEHLDLDEDVVFEQITEEEPEFIDGELSWFIQGLQGRIARRMGFLGCEAIDEQGTVYIIDMTNRVELLKGSK